MKIAIINASAPPAFGLSDTETLAQIVTATLTELGEELTHIRLDHDLPFYGQGVKSNGSAVVTTETAGTPLSAVHNAIYEVMACVGAVFVVPTALGGPSSLMMAFLEHFTPPQFAHGLMDKNCMVVTSGLALYGGARDTFERMSSAIAALGGYDAVKINIPDTVMKNGINDEVKFAVEKQTEDFYRLLRQNRRFYPLDAVREVREDKKETETDAYYEAEKALHIRERADSRAFTVEQEEDITEITRIMAERFEKAAESPKTAPAPRPRKKTCKQLTLSMPHYFNPQLAAGLHMTMALNVSGDEAFSGLLTIDGGQCSFEENSDTDGAEVSVASDARVWTDVLTGKYSAQKAFMVGHMKVRGNFLLLTKLDQLFSKMDN